MKYFSALLLMGSIVCALFSNQIDAAVSGDKKVKKVIVICSVGVLLIGTVAMGASLLS